MAKTMDEQVMDLLAKVTEKKKEIEKLSRKASWATTCTIGFTDSVNDRVNIMTIKDQAKLVQIYATLLVIEEKWKQANLELGLVVEPLHQNYKISDWKLDLQFRAGQLSIENKKKELEKLDERVNKLVSPEQRREMELKALQAELGV